MESAKKFGYHLIGLTCVGLAISSKFWGPALGLTEYVPGLIGILSVIFLIDLLLYWRDIGRSSIKSKRSGR